MRYHATIDGTKYEIEVEERDGGLVAILDGREHEVDFHRVRGTSSYSLLVGSRSHALAFEPRPDGISVTLSSESYVVAVEDERTRAAKAVSRGAGAGGDGAKKILSMMPGIVRDVLAGPGDAVKAGDPLLILEAMKMENEIRAPLDGTVKTVHVTAEQTVTKGDPLLTLA